MARRLNVRPVCLCTGMEFAGILARFGADVHIVMRDELPLKGFDDEVSNASCCKTAAAMLWLKAASVSSHGV